MIISDMVGIIADDLTDASETALQFHLRGANSQILLDFDSNPNNVKNTQVWAISTATRNKTPEFADSEVRKATQKFLDNLNLDYYFKKIDSTLNGLIGIESLAMLETLNWDCAIIIPAHPATNKTTVGGYQLINGIPIERTIFARETMNQHFETHVPTMIAKQIGQEKENLIDTIDLKTVMKGAGPILQKINKLILEGKKLIVADAISTTDIEQIILACQKSNYKFLPVGTTATAEVLGKIWLPPPEKTPARKTIPELPKLIVSGTGTETTVTQLKTLEQSEKFKNTYFIELEMCDILNGVTNDLTEKITANLGEKNTVVLNASNIVKNFDGFSDDSLNADMTKAKLVEHISSFLSEITHLVTTQKEIILITLGGETSYKCCKAINSCQLQVIDEIAPEIALTLDHKAQWIVSKSGHIGNSNSIIKILEYFEEHKSLNDNL